MRLLLVALLVAAGSATAVWPGTPTDACASAVADAPVCVTLPPFEHAACVASACADTAHVTLCAPVAGACVFTRPTPPM